MCALAYLDSQRKKHRKFFDWFAFLTNMYQKKLWHQLNLELDNFIIFLGCDTLMMVYEKYISSLKTKMNHFWLAIFSIRVSQRYGTKEAGISFLESVIMKLQDMKEEEQQKEKAILCVNMQIALFKLEQGDQKECRKILEDGKIKFENFIDIEPYVYACFYLTSIHYYRCLHEYSYLHKYVLLYLANTSMESLPASNKLELAYELSISALLGDEIYNFGKLLTHPILNSLLGTNNAWLYYMLKAFKSGDLVQYHAIRYSHIDAVKAQSKLVNHEKKLFEKIYILYLMKIILSRPFEDKTIPLRILVDHTKLSIENVEHLLMRSQCVHVTEGIIDQVEGTVNVSWVQPRTLRKRQIKSLRTCLNNWLDKINNALISYDRQTQDFVSSNLLRMPSSTRRMKEERLKNTTKTILFGAQ